MLIEEFIFVGLLMTIELCIIYIIYKFAHKVIILAKSLELTGAKLRAFTLYKAAGLRIKPENLVKLAEAMIRAKRGDIKGYENYLTDARAAELTQTMILSRHTDGKYYTYVPGERRFDGSYADEHDNYRFDTSGEWLVWYVEIRRKGYKP